MHGQQGRAEVARIAGKLVAHLSQRILGQQRVIEEAVITVLCSGHALLTGAPGVAKTTLVRNLALSLGQPYRRVQFTPDLTPYDILGGDVLRQDPQRPEIKVLEFNPGPVFTPFLLADEINRASPRTQAALLEAMQERQVTLSGITHQLPRPFYVFATQNPIETEGTFPLPEAQLDRFLLNIEVPYPDEEAECRIAVMPPATPDLVELQEAAVLAKAIEVVETLPIPDTLLHGIVRLVRNTRPESSVLPIAKNLLEYGASPRAAQALVRSSQALALLRGAPEVTPEHIFEVAPAVLCHRCIAGFRAAAEKVSVRQIVAEILRETVL